MRRRLAYTLLVTLAVLLLTVVAGGLWVRSQLHASLPALDGRITLAGLGGPVSVERDPLGIPWVRGATRADVVQATGFLHAQERFFQMDLARRRAAGELAAIVGPRAVPLDRAIRIHRFRAVAREAVRVMTASDRHLLDRYTEGVNAGLRALDAAPFEYLVLRQDPEPWQPEDTFLVILSMFVTLQEDDGAYERTLATMAQVLPVGMVDFLAPRGRSWDAPIDGSVLPSAPIPGPEVYDLRSRWTGPAALETAPAEEAASRRIDRWDALLQAWDARSARRGGAVGSNNWAIAGRLTPDGRARLANDMHLPIRVPNTWYRAALEWRGADGARRVLAGVTLPGCPALVVGTNTYVAWGFTNTYADWSDIVRLELDPADRTRYRTPAGWKAVEYYDEVIRVAGAPDERERVAWTIWGPVLPSSSLGDALAYRWVAHDPERLATSLTPIEEARTVQEALDAANGRGVPGQNIVAVDRDGHIGWSIFGAIPRRVGLDGRLPASWADGARGWQGWLHATEYPRVIDPPSGRLWTANARVVGGDMLARLGDGSYEVGSRATIIRNRLMAREQFTDRDLLAVQLDTSADFLSRWRDLLLRTWTPEARRADAVREEAHGLLTRTWSGRADAGSVAYRLTRMFRDEVTRRALGFLFVEVIDQDPAFDYLTIRRREEPLWQLVTERPMHLLHRDYPSWDALLLEAADAVLVAATASDGPPLSARVWSEYSASEFRHPLSGSLPLVGRWLDMPPRALPGDLFTPRMHWRANGASERMIIAPGHEDEAIMHMPTGQSGHPLSPFYANSHEAWVEGRPTPFLPGEALHTLRLIPPP